MTSTSYTQLNNNNLQNSLGELFTSKYFKHLDLSEDKYSIEIVRPYFRKHSTSKLLDELFEYEKKYGLKSAKVYSMYVNNHLNRESKDFLNWAILFKKFFIK